jgi:hypothetical protein
MFWFKRIYSNVLLENELDIALKYTKQVFIMLQFLLKI